MNIIAIVSKAIGITRATNTNRVGQKSDVSSMAGIASARIDKKIIIDSILSHS